MGPMKSHWRTVIALILPVLLASCGSRTENLVAGAGQDARSCVTSIAGNSKYGILKNHTNIEHPEFITADMTLDKNFATTEEALAFKSLTDEFLPCKIKFFETLSATAPDLQLILIKAEIRGKNNISGLVNKKISWGLFNKNVVNNTARFLDESRPALQRLQARINIEQRQAAIARQQALQALAILADTALTLNAISEANRPILTTCSRGGLGTVNCVSR